MSLVCNVCQLTIFFLLHFNFIPGLWTSSPAAHILDRMTKFLTLSASQRLMLPSWTAKLSHGCRVKITSSLLTSQPVQPVILVQREQWSPFITKNNNKNIPSRTCQLLNQNRINYNFLMRGVLRSPTERLGTQPLFIEDNESIRRLRGVWVLNQVFPCIALEGLFSYLLSQPCSLAAFPPLTNSLFCFSKQDIFPKEPISNQKCKRLPASCRGNLKGLGMLGVKRDGLAFYKIRVFKIRLVASCWENQD